MTPIGTRINGYNQIIHPDASMMGNNYECGVREQHSTKNLSCTCKGCQFHWKQPWQKEDPGGKDLEGGRKGTQMVDFEKDTRRWWFSPRSWLWNSMRDSMASSTEPIWIRAILRSFLLRTDRTMCSLCCMLTIKVGYRVQHRKIIAYKSGPLLNSNSTNTQVVLKKWRQLGEETDLLKEFEGLDCGSWASKKPLEFILHHRGPERREES